MADLAQFREENPETQAERKNLPLKPVALLAGGMLLLLAITPFVLMAAFPKALPDVDRKLRIAPPGPRLQTDPAADLARFRADEERRLRSYYWVNKQQGIVHIPIDKAMRELVQTGIPGFPKAPQ